MATLAEPPVPAPATGHLARSGGWSVRARAALAATVVVVVVGVNVPAFLRTALDCDPILFDLFARDMARGRVLYRDMLENNTPGMIGLHALVRSTLGDSTEALRVVDLLVVGAGAWLLAGWFHRGRPDLRVFTFGLLATLYLTTTEWCHVQRDVWLLLPVMAGMYLRRAQLGRLTTGRGGFARAALEGAVWGLAVWLKPHALLVAAPVWVTGAAWARCRGASGRAVLADAAGLFVGALAVGAAGVGVMDALGIWRPYLDHVRGWLREYAKADMNGEMGPWFFRLGYLIRNAPWSLLYVVATPAAMVLAVSPVWAWLWGRGCEGRPDRPLLGAALAAWAVQAWCVQHVFDYPHIGGEMLAVALLVAVAAGMQSGLLARTGLGALAALTALGHIPLFAERARLWGECVRSDSTPELRDRLARYKRIGWADLHQVAGFLQSEGGGPGEVAVISDTALPLWDITGQTPPVRYYIVHNNMLAFPSRRGEILAAIAAVPGQRFLVCDIRTLTRNQPEGCDFSTPGAWPLPATWYGPRRWADRVAFRAGGYLVLRMRADEVPAFMADGAEF